MTNLRIAIFLLLLTCSFIILFTSCKKHTCKPAPDVSNIEMEVKIKRFDQDLFTMIDTNNIAGSLEKLYQKYPAFGKFYFQYLNMDAASQKRLIDGLHYNEPKSVLDYFRDMGYDVEKMKNSIVKSYKTKITNSDDFVALLGFDTKTVYDSLFYKSLSGFINHPSTELVYDTMQLVYKDVSDLEAEFADAFKYLKHYFPNVETPTIYTMYSEFTNPVIGLPEDNIYVVSLDWFFGEEFGAYYKLTEPTPQYLARTLYRDHITSKVLQTMINNMVSDSSANSLLDHMIINGKKRYILDKLLPCKADYIKSECTQEQLIWMENNELQMWAEVFVDKLYHTNYKDFQKYVSPSPHSPDMPIEAPGNTGTFIGWKIVEAFMQRNPNYTLEQMIQMNNSQDFLRKSNYKPKK
jgi:hypothetical protein